MNAPGGYLIRRATTDDVRELAALLEAAALPAAELEKQFTEFQVALSPEGRVVGALALQVAGADGKLHSETYADFALSDTLRPRLWQRVETLARSHGLFRLWTAESAPYWKKDAGFASPSSRPPAAFGVARAPWLVLRLKDEGADPDLLEAQFRLFRDAEQAKREKLLQRAAALKMAGTVIAALLFFFALGVLVWFLKNKDRG